MNQNVIEKVEIQPVSFGFRLIHSIKEPALLGVVALIAMHLIHGLNKTVLLLVISSVFLVFLRKLHWYKYLLQRVVFLEHNKVQLIFFKFNAKQKIEISIDELTIIEDQAFVRWKLKKLVFKRGDEKLLTQYEQLGWTKEKLQKIVEAWKEAKAS